MRTKEPSSESDCFLEVLNSWFSAFIMQDFSLKYTKFPQFFVLGNGINFQKIQTTQVLKKERENSNFDVR